MKILVTGGSGLVGKYIVDDLLSHGHTVGVLDVHPPKQNVEYHDVDVLSLSGMESAMKGYEVVVHMAGIPHPLNDPAEKVFHVNVNGTFNALEAAARNGIGKVVFTSSESTLGFAFMSRRMIPFSIPIDERHPLRPQDPYGLSKVICEQICKTYSERYGMCTVCLREPWIWVPEENERMLYRKLIEEYHNWPKNLWAYVHVFDVAQAHRLAVERTLPALHDTFFITANENWTGKPSRDLLRRHYPEVSQIAPDFDGAQSIISSAKAKILLGYSARYSLRDIVSA